MNMSHMCGNALLYVMYSTSHHDCAIKNDILVTTMEPISRISLNVYIKIEFYAPSTT